MGQELFWVGNVDLLILPLTVETEKSEKKSIIAIPILVFRLMEHCPNFPWKIVQKRIGLLFLSSPPSFSERDTDSPALTCTHSPQSLLTHAGKKGKKTK